MNRLLNLAVVSIVITLYACGSTKGTSANNASTSSGNSKESAVLWQQTSAEYTALCYQAFNAAINYLNLHGDDVKANTIVMDLDETVLDNSPYNGYLIKNKQNYSRETWKEWTERAEAELVPGVLEFIQFIKDRGYSLYFISNRREDELEATIQNLRQKNIEIDASNVLLRSGDRSKSLRRKKVLEKGNILMLIGDNLGDFDDLFEESVSMTNRKEMVHSKREEFGGKFIVLPNVMYGDWERTLTVPDPNAVNNPNVSGSGKFIKSFE